MAQKMRHTGLAESYHLGAANSRALTTIRNFWMVAERAAAE